MAVEWFVLYRPSIIASRCQAGEPTPGELQKCAEALASRVQSRFSCH